MDVVTLQVCKSLLVVLAAAVNRRGQGDYSIARSTVVNAAIGYCKPGIYCIFIVRSPGDLLPKTSWR
jgi:hypothetical protein